MKMLFRQRFFSWFDSYDIYDEDGNTLYVVKGVLSWGHCLKVFDAAGREIAMLKEEVLTFLPRFRIYVGGEFMGMIRKEWTLFKPRFRLDMNDWRVEGDWLEWDYEVLDGDRLAATVSKQLLRMTDTYVIDVARERDALAALMIVLAIDAAKCEE